MSHHYIKSDNPRVQAHIERLERRDKTVEHLFRRCLHLLEQAIAGITLLVLIVSLGMACMALLFFLTGFEKRKTGGRRMVIVSVMTALCIVGRFIPI